MTNFKNTLMITAVVLAAATTTACQSNNASDTEMRMNEKSMAMENMTMEQKRMKMSTMSKDEKALMMENMSMDEKAEMKTHMKTHGDMNHSHAEKHMMTDGTSIQEKAMKMEKMSMEQQDVELNKMPTDERAVVEQAITVDSDRLTKDGKVPTEKTDTPGEYLQDAANVNRDKDRAIAVPGSNGTVTTVTCPVGTEAQTNGTCMVTGDYTPEK